ncbi:hypothetical protein EES43_14950 [Streptomyces sp. ADI96-02]|uniref:hypothetical protein n=1 Tax=unclassified Streptomyces TaxID=2593676 RepID=UPI000F5524C5|nr:hypothetical protein [Streptomyces sp. ADI96-02]RPK61904.1 hypothetical protein EES43_14950 [Streptomyces sp. ADI96-02]
MSPAHDVFTRICRSVEDRYGDHTVLCGGADRRPTPFCGAEGTSLDDLASRAVRGAPGSLARITAWRHIACHLSVETEKTRQAESGPDGIGRDGIGPDGSGPDWTLIAVGMLTPRLRGAAHAIARRTGAERADVASAVLQGALEAARAVERTEEGRQIEQHLIGAAFAVGWRTGRRSPKETPVGEVGERDASREEPAPQHMDTAPGELVRVEAMSGALVQQAQGERLGSLAHRMGLLTHVRQVRRYRRARQPRTVVHHPPGEPNGQPCLFETRGATDEEPW